MSKSVFYLNSSTNENDMFQSGKQEVEVFDVDSLTQR